MFPRKYVAIHWKMLLHHKKRLCVSVCAVAFAVLIMFMQLGFFNGFNDSQAMLASRYNADLIVMDHRRVHMNKWSTITRSRLNQVMSFDVVEEIVPVYQGRLRLRNPESRMLKAIFVMAFPPDSKAVALAGMDDSAAALKKRNTILFDRRSRPVFGDIREGMEIEVGEQYYTVAGLVDFGPSFSNDGNIIMSESTWLSRPGADAEDRIALGLIRVKPGTDLAELKHRILERLPQDILVITPEEMRVREVSYTTKAVPIGIVFGFGLVVGLTIGIIICYQILYNEIIDHLPQYATLKAIGFSRGYLRGVVLKEALLLAVIGFIPGLCGASVLYETVRNKTGIFMYQTTPRVVVIFIFTIIMCVTAANLAVKKVIEADPAEVF